MSGRRWTVRVLGVVVLRVELADDTDDDQAGDATAQPVGFIGLRPDQGEPYA